MCDHESAGLSGRDAERLYFAQAAEKRIAYGAPGYHLGRQIGRRSAQCRVCVWNQRGHARHANRTTRLRRRRKLQPLRKGAPLRFTPTAVPANEFDLLWDSNGNSGHRTRGQARGGNRPALQIFTIRTRSTVNRVIPISLMPAETPRAEPNIQQTEDDYYKGGPRGLYGHPIRRVANSYWTTGNPNKRRTVPMSLSAYTAAQI